MKKLKVIVLVCALFSKMSFIHAQATDQISAPPSYDNACRLEVNKLTNSNTELRRQLRNAQNNAASNQELARLKQDIVNYQTQIANQQTQLANAQNNGNAHAALQTELNNAVNERDNISQQYNNLSADYKALSAKYSRLKSKLLEEDVSVEQPSYNDAAPKKIKKQKAAIKNEATQTDVPAEQPTYDSYPAASPKEKAVKESIIGRDDKGRIIYKGKGGSQYYINENGSRMYLTTDKYITSPN